MSFSGLCILVVEDEFLIALDAERMLREAGVETVVLSTRQDFAQTLKTRRFDIVLLDTGPIGTGLDDDIALTFNTGAKLAFTTANSEFSATVPGGGKAPFVTKPYVEEQLIALIRALAADGKR